MIPRVSVIVASRNRPAGLGVLLDGLAAQRGLAVGELECIVAWSAADPAIAQAYRRVLAASSLPLRDCFLPQSRGPGEARNCAASRARGELLFCLDDDCRPAPHCLAEALRFAASWPGLAAWGGTTRSGRSGTGLPLARRVAAWLEDSWREPRRGPDGRILFIPGLHLAVRRRDFWEVGGFPAAFARVGEDSALCLALRRHGRELGFNPRQQVHHLPPHDPVTLAAIFFAWGRANGRLRRHYPDQYPDGNLWRSLAHYRLSTAGFLPALARVLRTLCYHGGRALETLR